MGNSVSQYDYSRTDGLDHLTKPEYFVTGDAEPELGLSEVFRSNHNGTDKNTPLISGIPYTAGDYSSAESQTHYLWDALQIGKKIAGGDAKAFGVRSFRVPDQPIEHSAEQKAKFGPKYVQTGYTERKDGTVDRFEYKWATFDETETIALNFMRAAVGTLGLKPFESRIAAFVGNRPEYYFTGFGAWAQGIPIVPLYTTLGPDAIEVIFRDTSPELLLTSLDNLPTIEKTFKKLKTEGSPNPIKHVVVCDCILENRWGNKFEQVNKEQAATWETEYNVKMHGFSEVLALGQTEENAKIQPLTKAQVPADTLAFIMFTSGTTSESNLAIKGVKLTHGGFTSCTGASRFVIHVPKHESILSFLPLSHVFQICLDLSVLAAGSRVDFGSGDIRYLASDLTEAQPYCLPTVPRILQRFYNGVFDKINAEGFLKRWYVYRSYNAQADSVRTGDNLDKSYDDRVFKVIRSKMGLGNCKIMIVSAAPCPPAVLEFMKILLGSGTPEGGSCMLSYGLTESHAGLSTSKPGDNNLGHIGTPLTSCEFRLRSIDEMEMRYTDPEPRGELLVRGHSITPGYYNNDEENSKAFLTDKNGLQWYQTGDIVKMHKATGLLTIIDRRKNTLKLAQGEYVSLEKIISIYSQSPLLAQVFPYVNSLKSQIVGVLVPNMMEVYKYAVEKGWWTASEAPIIGNLSPEVVEALKSLGEKHQDELVAWLKASVLPFEGPLNSFERIKAFHVDTHYQDDLGLVFCEANGLLTPTLKLKTKFLIKHYQSKLEELYVKVGEPTPPGQPWF